MNRLLAAAISVCVLLVTSCGDSGGSSIPDQQYKEWRSECAGRATAAVEATDGMYAVGGNRWVDLVNECLMEKAKD